MYKYIALIVAFIAFVTVKSTAQQATGPSFAFDLANNTYDFGTVVDGDIVTYEYTFKNSGNQPLIIYKTEVACNCTTADWPKRPIMPGQSGAIKVTFKSEGNVGKVNKQIYVKSNAVLPATFKAAYELNLKGQVKAKK